MAHFLRSAAAVIAGLVVAFFVVAGLEAVSSRVYSQSPGVDVGNTDAIKAYMAQLPLGAFLFVLAAWAAAGFLGSWLATRLGPERRRAHGVVVGAILLAACIGNMLLLPHPAWFWAAALVIVLSCIYLGVKAGGPPSSRDQKPALV